MSYFPLDRDLLTSSTWATGTPEQIKVWLYLLLAANPRTGIVEDTAPAIAMRCGLPLEAVTAALAWLAAPDPHSRTKANEGRRIEAVESGWLLLTYLARRDKDHSTPRVQRYRARKRKAETERNAVSPLRGNAGNDEHEHENEHEQKRQRIPSPVGSGRRKRRGPKPEQAQLACGDGNGATTATTGTDTSAALIVAEVVGTGEWPSNWVDQLVAAIRPFGVVSHGKVGKLLLPIRGAYPLADVEAAVVRFCKAGRYQYGGLAAFVETVSTWLPGGPGQAAGQRQNASDVTRASLSRFLAEDR